MTNHTTFYNTPHDITAFEAKFEALKIAFSPVIFQSTVSLLRLGILAKLNEASGEGLSAQEIAKDVDISIYGIKVLLDAALSAHIVWQKDQRYILDKIGLMLLSDKMVLVNLNFMHDVCYQGLFSLQESIINGKPEGLKVFGKWSTIYPALSTLPEKAKKSWFDFDHYYSDKSFKTLLSLVFDGAPVNRLLDVGGNTGKWALQCLQHNSNVEITIADLPGQTKAAHENINKAGFADRFHSHEVDLLTEESTLPDNHDIIWMSQFLDCFNEQQIIQILKKAHQAMSSNTRLYILELFWDRQAFEPAAFSINCTSLYFTAIANGNSRMYHSEEFIKLIHQANLVVTEQQDMIGPGHTLLICQKA